MVKLFYASGSPYARIARVAVRELGLSGTIEEVEVTPRDPASALLLHNPGAKCRRCSSTTARSSTRAYWCIWRVSRPRLLAFFDAVTALPSFTATVQPELNL